MQENFIEELLQDVLTTPYGLAIIVDANAVQSVSISAQVSISVKSQIHDLYGFSTYIASTQVITAEFLLR
ncbi:hypothetical protein [Kushneria indalinina]|uniref:hypothetical protein n=1 Tax=Kushneria indalinina TaxID=184067 RepID=UPI0011C06F0B|nr:hypothetical protein [Kushneria indalinina]